VLPGDRGRAARLRLRLYLRGPLRAERALGDLRAPRPTTPAATGAPERRSSRVPVAAAWTTAPPTGTETA
jgi:hypothetical protein